MALVQVCFLQKAAGFCLLLLTILLTHWDLMLTSGRENYAETIFNIVQGSVLAIVGSVIHEGVR